MNDQEYEAVFGQLLTDITEISPGWVDNWGDAPRWLNRTVRFLLQVIGDREVQFVAGEPLTVHAGSEGEIHVFTPDVLISATILPVPDSQYEECMSRVAITSRKSLVRVVTEDSGKLRSDIISGRLQANQKITLHYLDGRQIDLPVADGANNSHTGRVLAFLPSLLDDLA